VLLRKSALHNGWVGDTPLRPLTPKMKRQVDLAVAPGENAVISLGRGLEILRAFRSLDVPLGNAEIAARTGLPKPTVARLTYTLVRTGHLRQVDDKGGYRLGEKVTRLGASFLSSLPIRAIARARMQELADRFDMSVALGIPDRVSMIYIEYCSGLETVTMRLRVGTSVPMGLTAMGRAYLWALAPEARDRKIAALAAAAGDGAEALRRSIQVAMRELDARGYAVSFGDWRRQVHAVGVPVWLDGGHTILAMNCGASRHGLSENLFREELGPALVSLSAEVSNAIGSTGLTFWND
jgi:IclR family transcriptional regulator, positive regulator for flagellar biogenesis